MIGSECAICLKKAQFMTVHTMNIENSKKCVSYIYRSGGNSMKIDFHYPHERISQNWVLVQYLDFQRFFLQTMCWSNQKIIIFVKFNHEPNDDPNFAKHNEKILHHRISRICIQTKYQNLLSTQNLTKDWKRDLMNFLIPYKKLNTRVY